jgi:hypothetical protein
MAEGLDRRMHRGIARQARAGRGVRQGVDPCRT